MNVYIQRWPDDSATLMFDDGTSVATYNTVNEALEVCEEWMRFQNTEQEFGTSHCALSHYD